MQKFFGILAVMWGVMIHGAFSDAPRPDMTPDQVQDVLPKKLNHPYLYFKESDKAEILKRIRTDAVCGEIYSQIKGRADAGLESKDKQANPQELAFVYQMTGDRRYAQKAFSIISKKKMKIPQSFNLDSSRACRSRAVLYDWLYTGLDEDQRALIRKDLQKLIATIRGQYDKTWWVHSYHCNWNPVCHSAAGVAAIALLADDPSLTDIMSEAYNGIYKSYNEIGLDGDWFEGVEYYSYGLFVSLLYADSLNKLSNGKLNLFQHPRMTTVPVSFILYGLIPPGPFMDHPTDSDWKPIAFHDSSADKRVDHSFDYNKIAEMTGDGAAAWIRKNVFTPEGNGDVFDIIWPVPDTNPALPGTASKYFKTYGMTVMRSDFTSSDKVVVAAICAELWDPFREMYILRHKGADPIPLSEKPWGMDIDTSASGHGHRHAGTFNLYWQGEAYISELGKVGYPSDFWNIDRWKYPFAGSAGHNVVFVNGTQQSGGKGVGGTVVEFRTSDTEDYTLMDASGAYPDGPLTRWRRHIVLRKPAVTLLLDEVNTRDVGDVIDVRFHSACRTEVADGCLLIQGRTGLMGLFPVVTSDWHFEQGKHDLEPARKAISKAFHDPGNAALYTDVQTQSVGGTTYLVSLIMPLENREQAKMISEGLRLHVTPDKITVSLPPAAGATAVEFVPGNDGWRLAAPQ